MVDLMLGLGGGEAALEGQIARGAVKPGTVQQPCLQPADDVATVPRDVVAGLERVVGRAQRRRVIVELHPHQLRHGLVFGHAIGVAADVLVQLVEAAHQAAYALVGLGDGQCRGELLMLAGEELVRGVELAGVLPRPLLADGAECFQKCEGVIRQDDVFGVVGALLALDPTRLGQAAQQPACEFLQRLLAGQVRIAIRGGRRSHFGGCLRVSQVIHDLGQHYLARQAEAVELRQVVDAQQHGHVVALQIDEAAGTQNVEKLGRQGVEGIR